MVWVCAGQLADQYRRECCSSPFVDPALSEISCATDYILEEYLRDEYIGPFLRFGDVRRNGIQSADWVGSILIAVDKNVAVSGLSHRTVLRDVDDQSFQRSRPGRPVISYGERILEWSGFHFWRYQLCVPMHAKHESECVYTLRLCRRNNVREITHRFWIAAGSNDRWNVVTSPFTNTESDTKGMWPQFVDSRDLRSQKLLLQVIPGDSWSPFFLENKLRSQRRQQLLASVPYVSNSK